MKRKLAIALCSLYLISVIGVALSFHFCGGKLAAVSSVHAQQSCKLCKSAPKEPTDSNCCKNTVLDVKVDDSHQASKMVSLPDAFSLIAFLPIDFHALFSRIFPTSLITEYRYKGPPEPSGVALRILNCVFRN